METANEKKRSVRQEIAVEVLSSYLSLVNSWKMIQIAKRRLDLFDTQLKIERLKANMGETIRYELMKKEIERGESAIAYLDSMVKYLTAASALEISIGADIGYLELSKINQLEK